MAGDEAAWEALVAHYGGNPLALRVVGETIGVVFGSDIATFLAQGADVFGGIRQLLDEQVGAPVAAGARDRRPGWRWSGSRWGSPELVADLGPGVARGEVVEAVEALARRSLLERGGQGTFTLHPVVLEYATTRLVAAIARGDPGGRAGAAGPSGADQGAGQGLCAAQPGAPDRAAAARSVERRPGQRGRR